MLLTFPSLLPDLCFILFFLWVKHWSPYLLTGQLLSELGLFLLHATQLLLLALQAKLHLQRFAAVGLHRGALSAAWLAAASELHVSEQRPPGAWRVAAKVEGKRWPKGIWNRIILLLFYLYLNQDVTPLLDSGMLGVVGHVRSEMSFEILQPRWKLKVPYYHFKTLIFLARLQWSSSA